MIKFLNFTIKFFIVFSIVCLFFAISTLWYFSIGLPDYKKLSNYQPPISSRVYSNDGKLTMGPFWDYNLASGNADYCDGGITSGWELNSGLGCSHDNPFWFVRLLDDTIYQNKLKCRWEYLRGRSFHQDSIFNFIHLFNPNGT